MTRTLPPTVVYASTAIGVVGGGALAVTGSVALARLTGVLAILGSLAFFYNQTHMDSGDQ